MTETLIRLTTPRCRIDRLVADDAADLWAITDASVTSQVHFLPEPFTKDEAAALIARSRGDDVFHAVRDAAGLAGVIGVHRRGAGEYEVGYWFAARARGKGLAREAVGATVREIAAARRGATVVAECRPGNARSEALLRAVGFVPTGTAGRRPGRALFVWRAGPGERIDVC